MAELQNRGWVLGLNSDTPLLALEKWSDSLGLLGPIIAEKGGVVMFGKQTYFDKELEEKFKQSKNQIINAARNIPNLFIWEGDQVDLIRRNTKLPDAALSTAILVSNLRLISISFHIRRVDFDGTLINDKEVFKNVIGKLHSSYPIIKDLEIDENPEYGIVILSSAKINKRAGVKSVMELASWTQIGMVGDSNSDFIGHDIATQYAVSNSSNEYKQKSDFLATNSYTDGVKEICDLLIRKK